MNNTNDVIPYYNCDSCKTPVVDHVWKLPKPANLVYLCDNCWDAFELVEDEEEEFLYEYDCDE